MFRSTIVKSAATAAARRSATVLTTRSLSTISRPAVTSLRTINKPIAWKVGGIRGYAAAGGLTKEDVEGRITSLLAGFDKVR